MKNYHPKKTRSFQVYEDPGHAWVKVPKKFLRQIIGENWRSVFTHFSYERNEYVYLEEDEDVSRFRRWCIAYGIRPILKPPTSDCNRSSRIRNYSRLQPIGD
ncbi:MAG: hypothetical protein ACO4CS_17155 [bacterium]